MKRYLFLSYLFVAGMLSAENLNLPEMAFLRPAKVLTEPAAPQLSGVEFDGSGRIQGVLASSAMTCLTDDFSMEAVFKPSEILDYSTILWKGNRNVEPQRIQYYLSIFKGRLEFKAKDARGNWHIAQTADTAVTPGLWYRAVVRFKAGQVRIFLNGRECRVTPFPLSSLIPNDDPAYIGSGHAGNNSGNTYNFRGVIRNIRLERGADAIASSDPALEAAFRLVRSADAADARAVCPDSEAARLFDRAPESDAGFRALLLAAEAERNAQAAERDRQAYRAAFRRLAGTRDFALFTLPTGQGFKRGADAFRVFDTTASTSLKAARGESESFQLLPAADAKAATLELAFSGFTRADGIRLPSEAVAWGEIKDITAARSMLGGAYHEPYVGSWPDLIMDDNPASVTVPAGGVTPVFFRVSVPENAEPGKYQGVFTLKNATGSVGYPVELTVRAFSVPARNSLPVAFSFFKHFYTDYYRLKSLTPEEEDSINRFLLAYRIPPNNIYAPDLQPSIRELKRYDLDFATCGYFFYRKLLRADELNQLIAGFRTRLEAAARAGAAGKVYLYAFDEIVGMGNHHESFPAARQILSRFKQEFPEIKRLQTSAPHPELMDLFDVWIPLFSYFNDENIADIREMQSRGVEFWWYPADDPQKPYPNFFLGYPVNDLRLISTLTYLYDVRGILYWCVNREWATNRDVNDRFPADSSAWEPAIINIFNQQKVNRNGMGNLIYPGRDGRMYPSLRLENFRDGIEDYEYLMLLKRQLARVEKIQPGSPLIAEARQLLQVPPDVASDLVSYSESPKPLMKWHDRLGDLIEVMMKVRP